MPNIVVFRARLGLRNNVAPPQDGTHGALLDGLGPPQAAVVYALEEGNLEVHRHKSWSGAGVFVVVIVDGGGNGAAIAFSPSTVGR